MLRFKKLDENAKAPVCAHPGEDLGYDLFALEDALLVPGEVTKVRTGIVAYFELEKRMQFPIKFGLLVRDRSSMAAKNITISAGVVDAGYRGELVVLMTLHGSGYAYQIKAGDKIAQVIPMVVYSGHGVTEVDEMAESQRGEAGFGSTGTA